MTRSRAVGAAAALLLLSLWCPPADAQDIYEPDDAPFQASVIVVDDVAAQAHDFYREYDEDWVTFYAVADEVYELTVRNPGADCDAVIELYGPDGMTLLARKDDYPAGSPERLTFTGGDGGVRFARVANYDGTRYGAATSYELRVYRPIGPPVSSVLKGKVFELTTGSPIKGAVLISDEGGSGISSPAGDYLLRSFEDLITLTVRADGFRPLSAPVSLTPAVATFLDIPLQIDTSSGCFARLQDDLALLLPHIRVGELVIWATMAYDSARTDKVIFEVKAVGVVADPPEASACPTPPTLTDDLILHVPVITFGTFFLRADLAFEKTDGDRILFEVTGAEVIGNPQGQ